MPLLLADIGKKYIVKRICANEKERHYLESLGFLLGQNVSIVSKFNGYIVVRIKGSRIAIGREVAKKIII